MDLGFQFRSFPYLFSIITSFFTISYTKSSQL